MVPAWGTLRGTTVPKNAADIGFPSGKLVPAVFVRIAGNPAPNLTGHPEPFHASDAPEQAAPGRSNEPSAWDGARGTQAGKGYRTVP